MTSSLLAMTETAEASKSEIFTLPFQYFCLENSMGRLQSMGSQRMGHDGVTNTHTPGKERPTPYLDPQAMGRS